ncbi:MAG: ATP-dependent helicase [Spirochaetaceae bacterium]|jgi:DNA helicase-2/ATP-dependent DNA helicase PcrA|nr:ATP-dependent helicase [Spirochaetaceae bacterium]
MEDNDFLTTPDYLAMLNEEQRRAVLHTGKPLLILAGAGSGKTRVITTKIAYFIREKNMRPWSILAVTFTNKAAKEMAARAALIEPRAVDSMLRTFHSFGAWFLRRNCEQAGLGSNFIIYDDDDSLALLASLLPDKRKDEVKILSYQIAKAKDMNLSPDSEELALINGRKEFRTAYTKYEERLRQIGNVDFGDLIKKPVELLRENPDIKARMQDRFRALMVDEYQDANVAQAELLKELTGPETYLCVVGDDDQSIYRFRGAEVRNILQFPEIFGGADIIKLETNYRSTQDILGIADSVVRNNRGRHGKKLVAARGLGFRPKLMFLPDAENEAECAGDLIIRSVKGKGGAHFADWAILYRTNAQSLNFENQFVRRKIPYKVIGSLKFYEREEIKDALALLSFMVNTKDEVSFRRIINKPARGIGAVTIDKILSERWNEQDWNIETTMARVMPTLAAKARSGIAMFLAALAAGRNALSGQPAPPLPPRKKGTLIASDGLSVCVAQLIEASGLVSYHLAHDEINGETRVANLQELVNSAGVYNADEAGLSEFLERIELDRALTSEEAGEDYVTLITLHNTKGLEFKRVIMTGMEQGLFPRENKKDEDLEEERRLFYVGATRAMDELYFTSCAVRRVWGQIMYMEPSLFLQEADKSKLDIHGQIPYGFYIPESEGGEGGIGKKSQMGTTKSVTLKKTAKSSDGRWQIGDRVFNDDYGYGAVAGITEGEDGPVIRVQFETGFEIKFLSRAQSKNFLKIQAE